MIEDSTITNTGDNSYGFWADKARLTGKKVTIEVKEGQKGRGVIARDHAHVTLSNDSKITGTGKDFLGLWAYGNQTNFEANNLTIDIKGKNGGGVSAAGGAQVSLKDSRMTGDADAFVGFVASDDQSKLTVNNTTITANGQNSRGLKAVNGAEVTVKDSMMTSTGDNFYGLWASGDKTHLEGNNLTLDLKEGQRGRGVTARNNAHVILNDSKIIGTGPDFFGLSAYGEHAILTVNNLTMNAKGKNSKTVEVDKDAQVNIQNGSVITTEGAFSPAIQLTQKGRLNVSDSAIKTLGKNSATFYVAPGNSEQKSVAEMTGGSLEASGDLILSQGGTMDVVLNQVSVSSPGSGYLLNVLNSNSGQTGEVNLVLNDIKEPGVELEKKQTLRGNISAAEGSKANVTLNRSELIGWANNATHVSIDPASTWLVTGPSMLKDLHHEGKIQFQSPSSTSLNSIGIPGYKSLSLENLSGTGMFWMNTDIAGHQGDFLNVRRKAEGEFGVMVKDSGQSPRADDSLKIIQTGGGDAKFTLANEGGVVDVGTYQYYLVPDDSQQVPDDRNRVLDDRQRGWSLVSHQPQPAEKPQPESEPRSQNPVIPSILPEVDVVTAASGEIVPHGMIDQGSPGQAPTVPEPNQPATVSSIQTVDAGGTPGSVEAMRPEVIHQPQPSEKSQPGLESHRQSSVNESVTETVLASRPLSGGTILPQENQQRPQSGIIASKVSESQPAIAMTPSTVSVIEKPDTSSAVANPQTNIVAQSASNPDEPLGVHSPSPSTTVNAVTQSGAVFSTIERIFDDGESHTLTENGFYKKGIEVKNKTTVHHQGALSVTSSSENSPAVKVIEGSTVTLKGAQDKLITVATGGAHSPGLYASDTGTEITANAIDLTTKGKNSEGVKSEAGAKVGIGLSTIVTTGENAYGLSAVGDKTILNGKNLNINVKGQEGRGVSAKHGANVTVDDSSITGEGNAFRGLFASDKKSNLTGNNLTIVLKGEDAIGVKAQKGASVTIDDSSITNEGESLRSFFVSQEKSNLTGNNININAQDTIGVLALSGASATINNSTISGDGQYSVGLLASGEKSQLSGNNMNIEVNAQDSAGVIAYRGATVKINNGSKITTHGGSSHAALLSEKSTLKITDSDIKTTGTDSAILYGFTPENEGNKSFTEITGGSLDARGDLIASKGGKMDVVLNNVSISSPGSGYALNILNSDSGHPGEVNLMVNQTKLPGHIHKESGLSRANVTLKGSELSGNVMNATSLLINPQSTWFATGNSVFKSLINEGNIKFQSHIDDTRFNKITIHTLTGPSTGIGMFWMNTDIAGHRGDFLNVTGKAKGNFGVMVSDSGQSPKADDSLKIIQTGGGDAKFTLANRGGVVDVGTYQYYLVPDDRSQVPDDTNRVLDDRERVWSLVSHQPQPSVKPQPESELNSKTRVTPSISSKVGTEIPESSEMVTSGSGSHRQPPVNGSVTDTVVASRRMPGATVVPKTEQQPQPGIVAPAQKNLVAQSALKPNASFDVHSPSPLPTVNTVTESEPIFSTTTLSTITIQGQKNHTFKKKSYHQGIEIKGQSTVGNTGDLSISTSHKNHPAVKVSEGSIVTLKGNDDKLLTLTTIGADSPGLLATDTDTEIIANKIDITTQGENSEGVKIVNDARVIMNDSNITENGENAYGVWAEGEKTHLMANNVEIELNAQNATGIKAVNGGMVHIVESSVTANDDNSDGLITEGDKSNLRANDLEIEINGHNSTGVKALQGGAGIIENSSIIGHGNAFVGLSAAHEKTHLTGKNLNIEVQNGPKGTGVVTAKGAEINIENGTIIGTGKDFIGLLAADQKTNLEVNQMSIQANAEDSQGVIAENGAKVTVENSSIIGNWENFDGLRSRGENANLTANNTKIELHRENSRGVNIENGAKVDIKNGSQIITRGAFSPAIQLAQKGRLNVSDSAIKTLGKNSATFYVAPGNSDKKSVAEMTGGSLEASGDLILSQGGTMDVVLNKVSVSSPGSGYLVNVLNSDSGYPGEVSLSVLNPIGEKDPTKTLRGNIVAAEGSKANVSLKGSTLIGWANNATHMSIDPTSQWSITGLSTLKQLNNEGKVEFQGPSATSLHPMATPVYKTLSLGSLSGTGMFWMNTDIAGHQGDFLNVRGKAEGKFGVMVNDSGNSPTAEDSLKIIQTGGGDARFTLANEGGVVDVGTYQYYLVPDDRIGVPDDRNRVLDDRERGWSLVSHQPQPSTKPKPESELNPKTPVTPSTPPEVAVVTAASGETVPRGMIEQGSPGQAPTVPETNQPATVSFIQTVAAGGTPGSVEAMRPEVIQTSPPPVAAPVFLSPTAYNIDQSGPVSSKEKTTEKTEDKNLFDDGESHTLAENGVYEKGIEIKNRTTVQSLENQGTVSISSDQNAKSAVKASESAIVTLKGNEDKLITVRTTGNHSPGLLASGTGTTITTDKMVIITEGQRSEGIKVHGGATAIINNGIITGEGESFNKGLLASGEKSNLKGNNLAITLTGNHAEGVIAERGAEVNIKDSTINVEKDNILNNGMTAFGEKTTLNGNKLTMNVNGINGIGVSVIGGAKAIIEESRLNSKGLNFQGLYASGHGSYLMANKMEMEVDVGNDTNNKIGAGALAKSAGKIDIKHSTLTGKGENFSVLRAEEDNAHVEGNTLTINVAGTKGTGVAAKNTGVVIINDSTINGTEEDFVGLLAQNQSQLKGKNITINAKGKNGRGVTALTNTDVVIEESKIIAEKENFYGLEARGENAKLTANKLDIKIQGESGIGAKTANGAKIIMNDSDITGTAEDFSGVLAHEDHTSLEGNHLNINVNGQNSRGVKVYNGGEVKIHGGRINSQGDRFLGLAAYQEKTNLEGNNLTIESKGKNGTGVKADSGAQVSLRESNINGTGDAFLGLVASGKNTNLTTNNRLKMEIKGQDGIGVKANSGAEVNVNDTTINGIGDDFLGIEAYQDETNLKSNNMTINVNGQNGAAIKIYKEAMANLRGTTIIGTGDYFSGLEAYQEKTNLEGNNLKIQSNGKNSRGIKAHNGAKADIHDSTVTGTGEGFLGLLAFGEKTHLTGHHLMIDINDAKNGRAVTAVNAQVGLNDSSITGTGENFIGIGAYQEKANFTGNKLTVKANGQNSKGITVQDGAHLSMNDSTVTTHEKNSAILYTLYKEDPDEDADNTKRKSVAEITRGSLEASGNLIVSEGGIMDVVLNNVSVFSRETADVLNVINQGDVNLVANQTNLTGNVFAAPGSKANVTLNKSTLVGWANATNLSVDSGSKWLSTGPSVLKDLKNEGKVQFQSPSVNATGTPGYQTLSLESLSGTGMFWMNTDIAGHQGDFLNVTGKAQGAFGVMVADSGKSPTAEDSLQIIQTGGGDARFTLANQGGVVDVGTYQYHLVPDDNNQVPDDRHRVLDDRARGWSLVSHRSQIKPPTHKGEELTPTPSVVTASASETGAGETQPDAHPESSSVSPTGEKVAEGAIALQKNLFDDGKSHMLSENSLYSDGIEVKNKTTVENTGAVTISSSRDSNSAVKVSEASTVTLKGAEDKRVTLTPSGSGSHALHASGTGTQVTANKIDITTHRDGTQGVKVDEGARVNIDHSTMTGNGEDAYGLWAGGRRQMWWEIT
ncbi:hypothetical protein CJJ19_04175 [Candidatus Williamhamiltonella defendens]|nr:pertactin-like passenger domain-containing protein [Candidatus Hamiltonella defensa]AYB48775.1 hypothetical protein CJJ19_04175 [Candidatus Hamiltonella defensa]